MATEFLIESSVTGVKHRVKFQSDASDDDLHSALASIEAQERDTGQSLPESAAMAIPRGAVSAAGSTIEGVGDIFGGDNFMHDTGRDIKDAGNNMFGVNPTNESSFAVKAGGVVGQVGEQVVETVTGAKLLGLAGIAGKTAVRTGIAVPSFLKGADSGEDVATQYGLTGMSKMASIYGAGTIEAATELVGSKFLGGTNLEEALATRLISPGLAKALGQSVKKEFIRGTVGEGIEEVESGIANDLLTKSLITEDPNRPGFTTNGQPMPSSMASGKFWGDRLEEFALGALGGAFYAGPIAVANRSKPRLAIDFTDANGVQQSNVIPAGYEDAYAGFVNDGSAQIRVANDTENAFADQVEAQQALSLARERMTQLEAKDSLSPEEKQHVEDLKSLDTTLTEWLGTKHAEEKINAAKIDDPADIDQAVASLQDARAIVTQGARAELTTDPALESQPMPEDFSEPPPPVEPTDVPPVEGINQQPTAPHGQEEIRRKEEGRDALLSAPPETSTIPADGSASAPPAVGITNPGFAPTENAPRSPEEQQKLDALPSPEFTAAMDSAHQAGEKFTPVAELKPKVGDVITSAGKEFRVESVNPNGTATIFNPAMGRNVVSDLPVQGHARIESSRVLRSGAKAGRLEPVIHKLKKVLNVDHVVPLLNHSEMNTALQEEATGSFADVDADSTVAPKGAYVQSSNHPAYKGQSVLYINKANATADTPIHELVGHQFAPWLKQNNFQLYSKGVELLKKNPRYLDAVKVTYFDEIEAARAKGGDQAAEDYLIEEAMATALGLNGQEIWRSTADSQTLTGQFVAWVKEMLAKFKDWATQNKLFGAEAQRLWKENQGLQTGSIDAWSKSVNRSLEQSSRQKVEKINLDQDKNTAPRAKDDAVSNDTGSPDVRQSKDAPATDADYMKAVESGDTESAQRMVDAAAKAAGYGIRAFHGTSAKFSEFKPSGENGSLLGTGIYFSTSPVRAKVWSKGKEGQVIPVLIKGNLKEVGSESEWFSITGAGSNLGDIEIKDAYNEKLKEQGFDGVVLNRTELPGKTKEILVFDPNQIKSADPVTYDNDGNVIPLSQRFNAGSPDIRFSKDAPDVVRHSELEQKHNDGTITSAEIEEAQRLVDAAAKAAGYNVGPVYHGTKSDFTKFGNSENSRYFFAKDSAYAKQYADGLFFSREGSPRVLSVFLSVKNPIDLDRLMTPDGYPDSVGFSVSDWRNAGFDGATSQEGGGTVQAFNPNQIKSADPFTGVPLNERFNPESNDIRFSKDAPAFYSQAAEILMTKMPKQASVQQVKGLLAGAKADEVKWSGIIPWLDTQKDPVSRDAVIEFLQTDAAGKFKEVTLAKLVADDSVVRNAAADDMLEDAYTDQAKQKVEEWRTGSITDSELQDWTTLAPRTYIRGANRVYSEDKTKYGQYQLPGGTNYRETVLAMPDKTGPTMSLEEATAWLDEGRGDREILVKSNPSQSGIMVGRPSELARYPESDGWKYYTPTEAKGYISSHFTDVPNYVAHMRTNERVDADGQPGLFIEEIQSDRHQEGRKKGYKGDENPIVEATANKAKAVEAMRSAHAEFLPVWDDIRENYISKAGFSRWSDLSDIQQKEAIQTGDETPEGQKYKKSQKEVIEADKAFNAIHGENVSKIADAPFRTTWPLQMFKRALRDAVESGKSWIGWTKGQTHTDRWGTEKISWFEKQGSSAAMQIVVKEGAPSVSGGRFTNLRALGNIDAKTLESKGEQAVLEEIAKTWKTPVENLEIKRPVRTFVVEAKAQHGGVAGGIDLEAGANDQGMNFTNPVTVSSESQLVEAIKPSLTEGQDPKKLGAKLWARMQTEPSGQSFPRKEGFEAAYDKMLVTEVGKYVKQWGATVEKSAILTQNSLEQKAFPNRKFDPDTPIWRVNITPAMEQSVSTKGQPMYSKEAPEEPEDAKPRKSEMAARQLTQLAPNEVNRITKAAVSPMRNSQGNEQAIEEAAAMFQAIGKAGGWDPHLAQLQSVIERYQQTPSGLNSEDIRSSEGQFVHDATPALYFGMMLKSLRKAVNSSQSTPRQKRAAISAMAKAGEIMANPAARAGRTLQGFAAAYRAITFPELHVEVIARNLLHGSDKNADLFNQEFSPIMDRLYKEFGDVFSEAAADPAKQERLLEKLRNAVGSSIAADDIADHTEAEMDLALNLSDLVFDELESWSGKAGKNYAEWRDILADKQILAMMDSEAKMSKGLSSAEVQLRRERLLKEMGGTASKKAISDLLATKTAREAELVAEMEKAFGNVRKPKTTVAPAATGASKVDQGAATVAAAIQRVLSAPTKTAEESGDAAWNILIAAIVRQMKSGIPKTTTAVKADKAVALAAMVSSPTDAAAVRKAAGDLLQKWAEENEGSFDKAAFDAALKTMVGSTFEADGEHQPFTAKDAQDVIKDELDTLKIDVRKIVRDGRLTNAAIDSVVKSVRDRLGLRYGGPAVLDRVEAVLRAEWERSLAERIKRIDETDRSRAQRKADEFMKRVDNAGYEADEKRRADAARKEREASAADIREARAEQREKARMNALRLKPLAAAEGVRAGRMKGEDALSFLARRFGFRSENGQPRVPGEPVFSLKEFLSTLDENVRKDGVEDMLHKVADYLGYDRYQTERFISPVLGAAMSQIDAARAEKLKKIFEPDAKKRKARESEIEKHIRLIKLGALDQEAYANVLLGARGKKGMTPEFKALLTDLIRRRDLSDEGSPQRLDIEREIAQAVSAARGLSVWGYMQNIFGAHIFSGPITQKVNFIYGFVGAQSALMTRARAAANMVKGLSAAEKLTVQATLFKEGLQGFSDTYARAAARFTLNTGHAHIDDPYAQFAGSPLEAVGAFPNAAMTAFGRDLPAWMNPGIKTVKSLTKFHKYVRRTMVASDLLNRAPVWESTIGAQALPDAIAMLRKSGTPLTQKSLENALDEVNYGVGGREAAVKSAETTAAEEQATGQLPNTDIARRERVRQLLQERLNPLDGMSTAERLMEINNIGRRSTLAYDVPGALGGLTKMLDTVAGFMPLGRQFMAAIKVPIAGLHTAMDYGPWGFLRHLAAKKRGGRASVSLWMQSWAADLKASQMLPDPDSAILSQTDIEALRIRATLGTTMFGLLAVAIAASLDEDDDKAKWFVSAQGPRDPEERRLWRQRGFNPWTIRIAGQDIGYRETPLFSILAPLGAMSDAKRYDNGKHWTDVQTRIAATSLMTLRALTDQAALDSVKKLFEATSGGDGDGAEKKFGQAATRIGAAFLGPNLFHDMNDILYGPQDTKNRSWAASIFANVPFSPSITTSKPALNVFGETIHEQRKGVAGEMFNSLRYRVATAPIDDPTMHFVAKMDIAKLFTGRRKIDGSLVMDDPNLVYEWGQRSGKALRAALTPEVISQFEKLKKENSGVALKQFDQFVSSIRTGALNEVLNESDK